MLKDPEIAALTCLIALFVLMIVAIINQASEDHKKWRDFSIKNNCKIVEIISDSYAVAPVISTNGSGGVGIATIQIQGKTGYKCDDGVTYYR